MKIALVILHADPSRGGAERYTADLARALLGRGHDVATLASSFAGAWPGRRVTVESDGATRAGRYRRFLAGVDRLADDRVAADQRAAVGSPRDAALRPVGPQLPPVVHAMLPVARCDVYHPHAGLASDARASAGAWGWLNRRRAAFAGVERNLLTRPDPPAVLCLSDYVKATVRQHYLALPADRLVTLFNAVDLARFDPARDPDAGADVRRSLGIPPDGKVALVVAQDWARKGVTEAVAATAQLAVTEGRPVTLVVVGRRQGHFPSGQVSGSYYHTDGEQPDVYPYYAAADLFVLPTRHDPCSLVVLEALAMGVPVVSTRFNGACEIMADGVHGRVLDDPADVGALADAMREFLRPDRNAAARAACLALRPALSFERHVDALEGLYRDVIARRA